MTDPSDGRKDLEDAKRELLEKKGRPFDVDKILAQNRAKEERSRIAAKKAEAKLEETVHAARERRHELIAREVEKESRALAEENIALAEAKRTFDKKAKEKERIRSAAPSSKEQEGKN